jgi:hypothetical protein
MPAPRKIAEEVGMSIAIQLVRLVDRFEVERTKKK